MLKSPIDEDIADVFARRPMAGGPASIGPKVFPGDFRCATRGAKDAGLPDNLSARP